MTSNGFCSFSAYVAHGDFLWHFVLLLGWCVFSFRSFFGWQVPEFVHFQMIRGFELLSAIEKIAVECAFGDVHGLMLAQNTDLAECAATNRTDVTSLFTMKYFYVAIQIA